MNIRQEEPETRLIDETHLIDETRSIAEMRLIDSLQNTEDQLQDTTTRNNLALPSEENYIFLSSSFIS
jgi:hypothetical protein